MSYTPDEQNLYDHARSSLPRWLFQLSAAAEEWMGAFVKIFAESKVQIDSFRSQTYLLEATGIWLDQHARDRGTSRRDGEDDDTLRARLRIVDDAQTVPAIKAAALAVLEGAGVTVPTGYPAVVELRRDRAFFNTLTSNGRRAAYLSRGYRMTWGRWLPYHAQEFVVILPYGTDEATAAAVAEVVRKKKAAGFGYYVERRVNP
jgi:hypothetical protein